MNQYISLLVLLVSAFTFSSCNDEIQLSNDKKIIIAGKIQDYTDSIKPYISINRLAFDQERLDPEIDTEGNFRFEFESLIPTDVWFVSDPYFIMVAKPGDSIYLNIIPTDTVIFSGDRKVENTTVVDFLGKWLTKREDFGDVYGSIRIMDQDHFIAKMDSIHLSIKAFVDFYLISEKIEDPYLKSWISTFATSYYYDYLNYYVAWSRDKEVSKIQKILLSRLPLKPIELNNVHNISSFINFLNVSIIVRGLLDDSIELTDANIIQRVLEFDKDPLVRQLILSENIHGSLTELSVEKYEQYLDIIDSLITEPYLREPLRLEYEQVAADLEAAKSLSVPLIIDDDFDAIGLLDSIIDANKGNIVFLDLWATWCGPCISEFKESGPFKQALEEQPITYIYICAKSDKSNAWKAMVHKYQLEGINIFFNEEQYTDFDSKFDITGFPTYMIYNKQGELAEKGFSWRPTNPLTLNRIEELLRE